MKPGLWWAILGTALVGMSGAYVRQAIRKSKSDLPVLGRVSAFAHDLAIDTDGAPQCAPLAGRHEDRAHD